MWFLAVLILLNAFLNNDEFVNRFRLSLGGMPVNVFDLLIAVGVLIALVRPRTSAKFVQTDGVHPLLLWIQILFVLAFFGGVIAGMNNGSSSRQIVTAIRNFAAAPAALYLAYFLTANVKSSRWYLYIVIVAGLLVSFMIVVFFKENTVRLGVGTTGNLNQLRAVAYISLYAGLAMALLFYSIASGLKLFPVPVALVLMGACLVGQFTTLSRSDWVAATAALGAAFALLPKDQRVKNFVRGLLALPFLIASIWIGLYAATQITGKDFFAKMEQRVVSMLPGDRPGVKTKAWDARLPAAKRELRVWASSPIVGGGFAIADSIGLHMYPGLRHNTWTATLSETGILGFAAFGCMAGGCFLIGRRMVRDRTDQTTMLIGAFGVITATFFLFHGLATMSFNQVRWGLPFFITAGVLLRTRAMQLALTRQAEFEQAMLDQHAETYEYEMEPSEAYGGGGRQQPALGNWYQTN